MCLEGEGEEAGEKRQLSLGGNPPPEVAASQPLHALTRSGEKRARNRDEVSSSGGDCSMAQSEANGVDQDIASKRLHSR